MTRLFLLIALLFFGFFLCKAQETIDEQKQYYTSKIENYLDREIALKPYYSINDTGIFIYAESPDKNFYREFGVRWSELDSVKKILSCQNDDSILACIKNGQPLYSLGCPDKKNNPIFRADKKLSGIKIAIDVGHIAGDMKTAMLEKKSIQFNYNNQTIALAEGALTLQTALILKHLLEEQGAEIMLTRDKPNQTAFGITFKEWLSTHFKNSVDSSFRVNDITEKEKIFLLTKATQREIFRTYFNNIDMRERAKKINDFAPDLTVVIHYNVDEKNTGWQKPSQNNYNMIFTGGSFLKDELEKPLDRLAFFRLLLTDDLPQSVKLAERLITSFTQKLNVPVAEPSAADYLKMYCIPTNIDGIYCRNLTLTRLIKGVVIYGETLYQDNVNECIALSKSDTEIFGIKTSSRVKQVAEAYYEGIINYAEKK